MAKIAIRIRNKNLALDIPHHGTVEHMYLGIRADERGAWRRAEDKRKQVEDARRDGTFDWLRLFPTMTKAKMIKLGLRPAGSDTFGAFATEQLKNWPSPLASSTARNYRGMVRRIRESKIATMPIGDIVERHVTEFEKWLATTTKPARASSIMILTRTLWNAAIRNKIIPAGTSPMLGIKLTTVQPEPRRIFTPAELQAIIENADGSAKTFLTLLAFLGCRPGEVFAMTWAENVDLKAGILKITHSLKPYSREYSDRRGPTKTKGSVREIRITPVVRKALEDQHALTFFRKSFVFLNRKGGPDDLSNFRKREWTRILDRAGVPYGSIRSLRNSMATHAKRAGASSFEIAALLGHKSVRYVETIYASVEGATLQDRAAAVDAFQRAMISVPAAPTEATG